MEDEGYIPIQGKRLNLANLRNNLSGKGNLYHSDVCMEAAYSDVFEAFDNRHLPCLGLGKE